MRLNIERVLSLWTFRTIGQLWIHIPWASYQIRKISGCACTGNTGSVSPKRSRIPGACATRNYTYLARGSWRWDFMVTFYTGAQKPMSGRIFTSWFKIDRNSFCSHPSCCEVVATKFYTWHGICAVVTCAKFCSDEVPCNGVAMKAILHRIWIMKEIIREMDPKSYLVLVSRTQCWKERGEI